jgi:hypothetical protein
LIIKNRGSTGLGITQKNIYIYIFCNNYPSESSIINVIMYHLEFKQKCYEYIYSVKQLGSLILNLVNPDFIVTMYHPVFTPNRYEINLIEVDKGVRWNNLDNTKTENTCSRITRKTILYFPDDWAIYIEYHTCCVSCKAYLSIPSYSVKNKNSFNISILFLKIWSTKYIILIKKLCSGS